MEKGIKKVGVVHCGFLVLLLRVSTMPITIAIAMAATLKVVGSNERLGVVVPVVAVVLVTAVVPCSIHSVSK